MNKVLIGKACTVNPKTEGDLSLQHLCSFIPMEFVSDEFGTITRQSIRPVAEVIKGYTFFRENDVLFAKITPCMENGKVAIAKNLKNGFGFGSTEFHVLRANEGEITPHWIFYFLRQDNVRKEAERRMTGSAGQQRVPTSFLEEELEIPLPSLPEQKRIAAILDKADRLRRQRRYAQTLSDSFLQSIFIKMFGDPVSNPMNWEKVTLNSIGDLDRGRSKHRPRNAAHLFGGKYPFIQTGDIANSSGYIKHFHQTYSEEGLKQSKLWKKGTLCITIAANIAKTSILTFDACFPDSVVGFTPNQKTNAGFIQHWFSFVQRNLEETAPESAQKNINLEILRELDVISPPLPLQEQFAAIVQKFERIRRQQREATRQAEHLFQTLLHRAFRGEL